MAKKNELGAIRLVGRLICVSIPAETVPFGLVAVAASRENGVLEEVRLVHVDGNTDDVVLTVGLEMSLLTGDRSPNEFDVDAWPVTTDPETRLAISDELLDDFAASSETAKKAVSRLRAEIAAELKR